MKKIKKLGIFIAVLGIIFIAGNNIVKADSCDGTCTFGPLESCPTGTNSTGTYCNKSVGGGNCCKPECPNNGNFICEKSCGGGWIPNNSYLCSDASKTCCEIDIPEGECVVDNDCGPCEVCLEDFTCSDSLCHAVEEICNVNNECQGICDFNNGNCQNNCLYEQEEIFPTECAYSCCTGSQTPCADLGSSCQSEASYCPTGTAFTSGLTECSDEEVCCEPTPFAPCQEQYGGTCVAEDACNEQFGQNIINLPTECNVLEVCCIGEAQTPCTTNYNGTCMDTDLCTSLGQEKIETGTECDINDEVCCYGQAEITNKTCLDGKGKCASGGECSSLAGNWVEDSGGKDECGTGYICCQDLNALNNTTNNNTTNDTRYICRKTCEMTEDDIKTGIDGWWTQANPTKCNKGNTCTETGSEKIQCCEKLSELEYKAIYGNYDMKDMLIKIIEIANQLLGIVGSVALLFFIIAGIKMIFSGGSEEKIGSARTMMVQTIIGLVIFLSAYLIVSFIQDTLMEKENSPYKIEGNLNNKFK